MRILTVVWVDLLFRMHWEILIEVMIVFADLIEAEVKELILDIKYPATKKQVNI